jgi:hypothetical protein
LQAICRFKTSGQKKRLRQRAERVAPIEPE